MNSDNKILSCEEARETDLVLYLAALGFEPTRISGHHYWYLSPFRSEHTASFKINRNLNRWYDFGEGKEGNLIDFGVLYFNCSVPDFLKTFPSLSSFVKYPLISDKMGHEEENKLIITGVKNLGTKSLLRYVEQRRIDIQIAGQLCREVSYQIRDKMYYAIGFKNDAGGYELRNPYFKGSSHPKAASTSRMNSTTLNVFEGFFDYLSYQTILKNSECISEDSLVLNSLSFLPVVKTLVSSYQTIDLFLDNDKKGKSSTAQLQGLDIRIQDCSALYKCHKDLNDWSVHFGLPQSTVC